MSSSKCVFAPFLPFTVDRHYLIAPPPFPFWAWSNLWISQMCTWSPFLLSMTSFMDTPNVYLPPHFPFEHDLIYGYAKCVLVPPSLHTDNRHYLLYHPPPPLEHDLFYGRSIGIWQSDLKSEQTNLESNW